MEYFNTDKDLLYHIVNKTNKKINPSIPLVFKGIAANTCKISSTALGAVAGYVVSTNIGLDPVAASGLIAATTTLSDMINSNLQTAILGTLSDDVKNLEQNKKLKNLLNKYYKSLYLGDLEGNKFNKIKALKYYEASKEYVFKIEDNFKHCFDLKVWLIDILKAEIYSHVGSIQSDIQDFEASRESFKESLFILQSINDVCPNDRILESSTFELSNSLRSLSQVKKIFDEGKLGSYDNLAQKLEIYSQSIKPDSDEELFYSQKILKEISSILLSHEYNKDVKNIRSQLFQKVETINQSKLLFNIGRYWAVRGCYDFILFHGNKNNENYKISTEEKIMDHGMNNLLKSIFLVDFNNFKEDNIPIEKYLNSDVLYHPYAQKALARNFSLLYGLGIDSDDEKLLEKYQERLALLYIKNLKNKNRTSEKTFWESIKTTDEKLLKPFDINIDFDKIKINITQLSKKEFIKK